MSVFKIRKSTDTAIGKSVKRPAESKKSPPLRTREALQISCSLANLNEKRTSFASFFEQYRQKIILNELELVKNNSEEGVYIVPSSKSLQLWYGVIFIRTGFFAEGIFHFNVDIPDEFPDARPVIRFTTKLFHPQVPESGTLNLDPEFTDWKRGRNHVWEVLRYTRSAFYSINTHNALNQVATIALHNNVEEFKARTRSCVLDSLLDFQEQEQNKEREKTVADNPFRCTLLDKNLIHPVKKIILNTTAKDNGSEEQNGGVIHWAKHTFGQMINNLSSYAGNGKGQSKMI